MDKPGWMSRYLPGLRFSKKLVQMLLLSHKVKQIDAAEWFLQRKALQRAPWQEAIRGSGATDKRT